LLTPAPRTYVLCSCCHCFSHHRYLHSFPTRRSSDLPLLLILCLPILSNVKSVPSPNGSNASECRRSTSFAMSSNVIPPILLIVPDRKSTRLNSSHVSISYAVFCLKKKKELDLHHVGE